MAGRGIDFFALGIFIVISITLVYAIIGIHDIPYNIAKKRNHPHQDAIHTAGWVSLFLMHALWPFLWIWATMYRPDRGWGLMNTDERKEVKSALVGPEAKALAAELAEVKARLALLEKKVTLNAKKEG
jgi:hypothetical protein